MDFGDSTTQEELSRIWNSNFSFPSVDLKSGHSNERLANRAWGIFWMFGRRKALESSKWSSLVWWKCPCPCRGVGTGWNLNSFPTQTKFLNCKSKQPQNAEFWICRKQRSLSKAGISRRGFYQIFLKPGDPLLFKQNLRKKTMGKMRLWDI